MAHLWQLFLMFLKVNLLTTSGPASVGLLYREAVGSLMTEAEFVEAVGFSSALPGSDALQLAMFVGYAAGGLPGALIALLGSILPPTVVMLLIVNVLQRISGEAWVSGFVRGLTPAVAVLMVLVAINIFRGEPGQPIGWLAVLIGAGALAALLLKAPAPLVLLAAGLVGIFVYR
ncbi:MAG TPA: chromate transporter [Anaerolineaceae bacterium]|nr:chromate transporter [Anaerolineaceae bacterium]